MRSNARGLIVDTEAEAHRCFAAMASQGQSIYTYAKAHGLCAKALYRWRDRLGVEADWSAPPRGAALGGRARRCERASLPLVELVAAPVPSGSPPTPAPVPVSAARYELTLGAVRVVVADDFRDDTLLRLLRVVASCSA
jgi:hypothetical protein